MGRNIRTRDNIRAPRRHSFRHTRCAIGWAKVATARKNERKGGLVSPKLSGFTFLCPTRATSPFPQPFSGNCCTCPLPGPLRATSPETRPITGGSPIFRPSRIRRQFCKSLEVEAIMSVRRTGSGDATGPLEFASWLVGGGNFVAVLRGCRRLSACAGSINSPGSGGAGATMD